MNIKTLKQNTKPESKDFKILFIPSYQIYKNETNPKESSEKIPSSQPLFKFPHFYQLFFNSLFILFISPVWISFKGDLLQLKGHPIHKGICAMIHILLGITSLPLIRYHILKKIRDSPETIFSLFSNLMWSLFGLLFTVTVWFKKDHVTTLIRIPKTPRNWKITLLCGLIVLLILYLSLSDLSWFYFDDNMRKIDPLDGQIGKILYGFFLLKTPLKHPPFQELSFTKKGIVIIGFVLRNINIILCMMAEVLVLISGCGAHEVVQWALKYCTEEIKNGGRNTQGLLQSYAKAKEYIEKINNVNGLFLSVSFILIISASCTEILQMIDDDHWRLRLIMASVLLLNTISLVLTAEVNYKMQALEAAILQNLLKNGADYKECAYAEIFMRNSPGQTGLIGGKFFIVSYSLIGQALSVFLTYTLVLIQFKTTPQK